MIIEFFNSPAFCKESFIKCLKNKEVDFSLLYETYLKGSLAEELADIEIRVFDYCGLNKINIKENNYLQSMEYDFSKAIFFLIESVIDKEFKYSIELLNIIAKNEKIDISQHIEWKMKYNESRSRLHGKKY